MLFSTVFQLHCGGQCTHPCFPAALLTCTLHKNPFKPLIAFPQNHCPKKWTAELQFTQFYAFLVRYVNKHEPWFYKIEINPSPHNALKIYSCRKHCEKRKNCLKQAISSFLTMFSTLYGTYFPF